jgi:hypothetical protein
MSTADPPDKGFRAFVTDFFDSDVHVRIVTVAQSRDDVAQFLVDGGFVTTDLAQTKNNTWDLPFGFCHQPVTVVVYSMVRGEHERIQNNNRG